MKKKKDNISPIKPTSIRDKRVFDDISDKDDQESLSVAMPMITNLKNLTPKEYKRAKKEQSKKFKKKTKDEVINKNKPMIKEETTKLLVNILKEDHKPPKPYDYISNDDLDDINIEDSPTITYDEDFDISKEEVNIPEDSLINEKQELAKIEKGKVETRIKSFPSATPYLSQKMNSDDHKISKEENISDEKNIEKTPKVNDSDDKAQKSKKLKDDLDDEILDFFND